MALQYILQQVGFKLGLNPADSGQRSVLLRYVNTAAKELWEMSDMAGSLNEQYFKVNANQEIALPDYVGSVRAMRQAWEHIALKLSQMRPRYNEFNWSDEWRNWRIKGYHTLQSALTNQSHLLLNVEAVETPPITVNVSGSTAGSSIISETVIMNATQVQTANEYNDVTAFTKTAVSQYNVVMADIDGNQISYLANNKLKAQFQIIDVSAAPWFPPNTNQMLGWIEVLFKKALPWFQNDNDEFPAVGYDEVIITKCLQLGYEEQGNINLATAFYQKSQQMLAQIHENANRGTDDTVALVENPHDIINPRVGFGRDWRYSYRITGR